MRDPLAHIEKRAHAWAIRCCRRPSFSIREAASEALPQTAVPRRKSGARTRVEAICVVRGSGSGRGRSPDFIVARSAARQPALLSHSRPPTQAASPAHQPRRVSCRHRASRRRRWQRRQRLNPQPRPNAARAAPRGRRGQRLEKRMCAISCKALSRIQPKMSTRATSDSREPSASKSWLTAARKVQEPAGL